MSKHINNLRKQTESYRRTFSVIMALSISVLVLVVWLSVIKTNIFEKIDSTEVVSEIVKKEPSPLESLGSGFKRLSSTFSENVAESLLLFGKIEYKKAE